MLKSLKNIILCVFLITIVIELQARNNSTKSLVLQIKNSKNNLAKTRLLSDLAWNLLYMNPDSTVLLSSQASNLCLMLLNNATTIKQTNTIRKELAMNYSINGMGYFEKSNYVKALEMLFKALKIDERLNNKEGVSTRLGNIGNVYAEQLDYEKALQYYFRALALAKKLKNKERAASHLGNIGNVYSLTANYSKALTYYFEALKVSKELGEKEIIASTLGNIGVIYKVQEDYPKALEYYNMALKIEKETGNKSYQVINFMNMGLINLKMKKKEQAKKYFNQALTLSQKMGSMSYIVDAYENLSDVAFSEGNYKLALEYFKLKTTVRDSLNNNENTKKQTQLEMQYEFDKQQTADSIKTAERSKQENFKHEQEIKQQKIYTYGGIAGFCLMLVVAVVSIRAFRNKQKANIIIEQQKQLVEEKQKEVMDSIHYAKRIQMALLPSEKYIERKMNEIRSRNNAKIK